MLLLSLATLAVMEVMETIRKDRVVAVIRASRVADPVGLATTLAETGIRAVEFTFTIPNVLEVIQSAVYTDGVVGAGTVLDPDQARAATEAGARFVVSPILRPELVDAASDVPVFLAGFTPTELLTAADAGATAVKLFPARIGGPSYVSDLQGPLPHVPLIPSGGVDESTAPAYLAAGAIAVYAGSSLAPRHAVEAGDHDEIARRAKSFVTALT